MDDPDVRICPYKKKKNKGFGKKMQQIIGILEINNIREALTIL